MSDASFEDGHEKPLNIGALDAEDLKVISALVQDAVLTTADIGFDRRARRLADAGRLPEFQFDQAVQNELRARTRWIDARQRHASALDTFKLQLGLPPDAVFDLQPGELARLRGLAQRIERAPIPIDDALDWAGTGAMRVPDSGDLAVGRARVLWHGGYGLDAARQQLAEARDEVREEDRHQVDQADHGAELEVSGPAGGKQIADHRQRGIRRSGQVERLIHESDNRLRIAGGQVDRADEGAVAEDEQLAGHGGRQGLAALLQALQQARSLHKVGAGLGSEELGLDQPQTQRVSPRVPWSLE
mgnify:CR=1 FL=1